MHDTVLPMAFNSQPKVTFSDQARHSDSDNAAEVQFTFGSQNKEDEDETEVASRPSSSTKLAALTETASQGAKGA